jgi:hypothetical protein
MQSSSRSPRPTSIRGAAARGAALQPHALAGEGRTTDKLRLTWGNYGLTLLAKERGELEKRSPRSVSRWGGSVHFRTTHPPCKR